MTKQEALDLIDTIETGYPFVETELREDYSGRGMFGERTCAVVTDLHPSAIDLETIGCRWDNMGVNYIYY